MVMTLNYNNSTGDVSQQHHNKLLAVLFYSVISALHGVWKYREIHRRIFERSVFLPSNAGISSGAANPAMAIPFRFIVTLQNWKW